MSRKIVLINAAQERINQISIGYIINPTLHVNKVFRNEVKKFLKETFHQSTMKGIKVY